MFEPFDIFTLRIKLHANSNVKLINEIMQSGFTRTDKHYCYHDTKVFCKDESSSFFETYIKSLLVGKCCALEQIGITKEDMMLEVEYHYDGQCNMEFLPEASLLLGREGIGLTIRCIDEHVYNK